MIAKRQRICCSVFIWFWSCWLNSLHSFCYRSLSISLHRSIHGIFRLKINIFCLLHLVFQILFGRPWFLLPHISRSRATLKTQSSIFSLCLHHSTTFAFPSFSTVFFNSSGLHVHQFFHMVHKNYIAASQGF